MSQPDIETKLREDVARAWASIDGKAEQFDLEKANPNLADDDPLYEGTYDGYLAEAQELLERSGVFDTIAALRKQVSDAVGESHQRHVDWNELVLDAERDFTAIVDAHMPGLARRLAREALERIRAAKPTLATLTGGKADA